MNGHREEHLALCAALAVGALDEADRLALEAHRAAGCPDCEREIARLEEAALLLAASATPVAPPAALKARTMAAVAAAARESTTGSVRSAVTDLGTASGASRTSAAAAAGGEPRATAPEAPTAGVTRGEVRTSGAPGGRGRIVPMPERRPLGWASWSLAAAAAVLAVATVTLWREGGRLRGDLDATRRQLADSEQRLQDERRWTAVLDALDARPVSLAPTPDGAADLRGRGTFDPATRRAVIVFDRVTPPAGRDYQLWGIHPSGPRSLGVVRADSSGRAIVRLDDVGDPATLQAFAISLEPAGGSPNPNAPSGPVVMLGRVGI